MNALQAFILSMLALGLSGASAWAQEPAPAPEAALALPLLAPVAAQPQDEADLRQRMDALEDRVRRIEARAEAVPDSHSAIVVGPRGAGADPQVGGTTVAAGDTVDEAVAMAGPVDVYGTVLGNATGIGGDVRVHAGGRVLGDAVAIGGQVSVDPGGEVLGDRVALADGIGRPAIVDDSSVVGNLLERTIRRLASLLSLAAAGVLVVAFWPGQVEQVALAVRRRPALHALAGFILVGVLGVSAAVLTLTIVGAPLAVALLVLLGVAWLLGFVGVCSAIGQRLPLPTPHKGWVTFLAGAALVACVSMVPWVGSLFLVAVGLSAVGAALISKLGNRQDPDAW